MLSVMQSPHGSGLPYPHRGMLASTEPTPLPADHCCTADHNKDRTARALQLVMLYIVIHTASLA